MDFKKLLEQLNKFVKSKNISNLIIIFLAGVLILIVTSFFKDSNGSAAKTTAASNEDKTISQAELSDYEEAKKAELKRTLELMQGVGRAEVLIYFEAGEELVPAVNINDGSSSINERDTEGGVRNTTQENKGSTVVITTEGNDSKPLILKKYYPKITGVMIVAEGAEDEQIRYEIMNVVSATFNISKDKVNVVPMKR